MIKNPNGRGRTGKPRGGHLLPDGSREHRYSRELAEEILRRLSMDETLTEICADPAIPVSTSAVRAMGCRRTRCVVLGGLRSGETATGRSLVRRVIEDR
jgi:hypothetical protein